MGSSARSPSQGALWLCVCGVPKPAQRYPWTHLLHCRPQSLARSQVLAHFPCKYWLTWRPPLPQSPTAGWLLAGPPVEGTACLVVTFQALQGWALLVGGRQGCEWRLFRAGLGLPGKEEVNVLLGGCLLLLQCLGGVTRGFICLSPHPLLPGWLTSAGPWGRMVLWDAAGNSQDLTLELQQRHKPWLCCCCSGCSIAPGQVVTAFAAFSDLSSPA